jgi:hypothetical protein
MARRKLTVDRHEEIKRRLADGRSLREIATALGYSRHLVRQIRDGERLTHETAASPDPLWMSQLEWPVIIIASSRYLANRNVGNTSNPHRDLGVRRVEARFAIGGPMVLVSCTRFTISFHVPNGRMICTY